jgi:hypothetical protein
VAVTVLVDAVEPILLEREPADISDLSEVHHWIRVYSSLLELSTSLPASESSDLMTRRFLTWQQRLDFWNDRARQLQP